MSEMKLTRTDKVLTEQDAIELAKELTGYHSLWLSLMADDCVFLQNKIVWEDYENDLEIDCRTLNTIGDYGRNQHKAYINKALVLGYYEIVE